MRHTIRSLARLAICAAAVTVVASGCSSPQKAQAQPVWADATPSSAAAPAPAAVQPQATAAAQPKAAPAASAKPAVRYVFPVIGSNSYAHGHHDYPATDIMTKCGNTFVAATSGVVLFTSTVDKWKASVDAGATRGGLSVAIIGDDGIRYYGSHLRAVDAGIKPGVRVTAGEHLGVTGDTGDASACHVHFGISPPCARGSDWYNQRGVIWPWPYLDSWKKGGQKSPVAEITAWSAKNGCPTKARTDP